MPTITEYRRDQELETYLRKLTFDRAARVDSIDRLDISDAAWAARQYQDTSNGDMVEAWLRWNAYCDRIGC